MKNYLTTNIRWILEQNYYSTTDLIEIVKNKNENYSYLQVNHYRFDFTGNRDSDDSYYNNINLLMLFPDIPVKIYHDYKFDYNQYKKGIYWLNFHKGSVDFMDENMNTIENLSGKTTIDILVYLINYFQLLRYYKSPFDLINK